MRVADHLPNARLSKFWSRLSLKRWLTRRQSKQPEYFADDYSQLDDTETDQSEDEEFLDYNHMLVKARHSFSSAEFGLRCSASTYTSQAGRHSSATLMPHDSEILRSKLNEKQQYKIFVATWNVGGKPPNEEVSMGEWLGLESPADIYVLGFQEVVPLNAGNVLGAENTVPAAKWLHLIRKTLNGSTDVPCPRFMRSCSTPSSMWQQNTLSRPSTKESINMCTPSYMEDTMSSSETRPFMNEACNPDNLTEDAAGMYPSSKTANPVLSNDLISHEECTSDNLTIDVPFGVPFEDISDPSLDEARTSSYMAGRSLPSPSLSPSLSIRSMQCRSSQNKSRFTLIASKQMVGVFMSVWIRGDLRRYVRNLKVCCVGCGLLGYLGNKGSISISMCIHQTSFCFVCSHLTSGQRNKDELRRNSDVFEILKRTQFRNTGELNKAECPENILGHDSVIWLGDLNYRLALTASDTRSLVAQADWDALLENDQGIT